MSKNNQKSKNGNGREITIDDLALMVASGFKEVYEIMGNGFKETHKIIDDRVSGLREEMNQRFNQVDEKFRQVDEKIEQIEGKIDHIDARMSYIERDVSDIKEAMIPPHEFEDLSGRVGYIEDKLGIEKRAGNKVY